MTGRYGILYFRNRALPELGEEFTHLELSDFDVHTFDGENEISPTPLTGSCFHLILADFPFRIRSRIKDIVHLKEQMELPLILFISSPRESVQIDAFSIGADDVADRNLNPNAVESLISRMKNLIRFYDRKKDEPDQIWKAGPHLILLNRAKRMVSVDGREIHLTPTEWNLLFLLSGNNGQVVPRESILAHCFEYQYEGYDRSIDAHVKNLRKKVPLVIETVRGVGYRFLGREMSVSAEK